MYISRACSSEGGSLVQRTAWKVVAFGNQETNGQTSIATGWITLPRQMTGSKES
jgi:hypothetical protein